MNYNFLLILPILFLWGTRCENVTKVENSTGKASANIGRRADYNYAYAELVTCAVRYDTACLVNAAEDFLDIKRQELLAQADQEVMKSTGRADPGNTPSHLAKTIEKLLSELAGFFKNGLSSLFRDAEDDDEVVDADEKDDENDDEKEDGETRDVNGEERGKKKKKKKMKKLFIILAVVAIKLCLLLKLIQTALLLKLALLGIGILGVSVAKLVVLIKHGKHKAIYYENSHHDHHYEHDDIWTNEHDDHGWGRSSSQRLAYAKQAPAESIF